jgi:hypothetical protein
MSYHVSKDLLIQSIIAHVGDDWFSKCASEAALGFARKGMIGWQPSKDNTLFELCVHGDPPNETPAYMMRFACDHWAGQEPLVAVFVIAQETCVVRRGSRKVIH